MSFKISAAGKVGTVTLGRPLDVLPVESLVPAGEPGRVTVLVEPTV